MRKIVGAFSYENGTLEGPAAYLREQGDACLRRILAGEHEAYNRSAHLSPDAVTAVLVWLQTDYAAWKGAREFHAMREAALRREAR